MGIRILLAAAAALALTGCGPGGGGKACKAPPDPTEAAKAAPRPPAPVPAPGSDPAAIRVDARTAHDEAKACVQRYAWRLSKSEEKTEIVAQAAVTACDAFIAAATEAEGGADLNTLQEANIRAMTRWATLYVVQYRANVCD